MIRRGSKGRVLRYGGTCAYCGEPIYTYSFKVGKQRFCSRACSDAAANQIARKVMKWKAEGHKRVL